MQPLAPPLPKRKQDTRQSSGNKHHRLELTQAAPCQQHPASSTLPTAPCQQRWLAGPARQCLDPPIPRAGAPLTRVELSSVRHFPVRALTSAKYDPCQSAYRLTALQALASEALAAVHCSLRKTYSAPPPYCWVGRLQVVHTSRQRLAPIAGVVIWKRGGTCVSRNSAAGRGRGGVKVASGRAGAGGRGRGSEGQGVTPQALHVWGQI